MDKTKYIKWYKLARETVNDNSLIPERTDEEIKDCVSEEDWLMFLPYNVTKEQAKSSEKPNVYFYREINVIGLTFNNVKAVDNMNNILSHHSFTQKKAIVDKLLKLDLKWKTVLNRKITKKHHRAIPTYTEEILIQTNTIDDNKIINLFTLSNQIRKEGREKSRENRLKYGLFYREVPSIDLMRVNIDSTEEEFKKRIIEVFEILKICREVKTNAEIRKIQREEQRQTNIKKCSNCSDFYRWYTNRTICRRISCSGTKLEKTKIPKIEYDKLNNEGKIKD